MITVEARILGRRKPLVPAWPVPVSGDTSGDGGEGLTLGELIARVVRDQVRAFEQRQEARKFVRALTEAQIDEGAARGKVDPGGRDLQQDIDVEQAIATAHQAFEDGLYLVLLDEVEQKRLEDQVWVTEGTRMVFLRLTFLAGG